MSSADIANIVTDTILMGCAYSLIGVGFVLVFRATGVVSFAQGAFMVFGALVCSTFLNHGMGLYPSLIISIAVLAVGGALVYRLIFGRLVGVDAFITSVATVGLGITLEAVAILIWGPSVIAIPSVFGTQEYEIIGAIKLNSLDIFTIVLTVIVCGALILGMKWTSTGLQMRAVANNTQLAAYTGVSVVRVSATAWAIAAASGAAAGIVYLLNTQPTPDSIYSLGLLAFPAILLGGFDSIGGAVIGGLLIALIQAVTATYIGGQWQNVVSYAVLLVVLLIRPQGLFGSVEVARL